MGDLKGVMKNFDSGATRSSDDGKPDYRGFISPQAQAMFGRYMLAHQIQADGQRRSSDNWKKGMPLNRYMSSYMRHVRELHALWDAALDRDAGIEFESAPWKLFEEELGGCFFNLQGIMHELEKRREAGGPLKLRE